MLAEAPPVCRVEADMGFFCFRHGAAVAGESGATAAWRETKR